MVLAQASYSPHVDRAYPTKVYWGDTHLHSNLSIDAYLHGNLLSPQEAYRFAKGEEVIASNGMRVCIGRPLDFLVITDHASNLGVLNGLENRDPQLLQTDKGRRWYEKLKEIRKALTLSDRRRANSLSVMLFFEGILNVEIADDSYRRSIWNKVVELADKHNNPGTFTAFIGYEWTQPFNSLHRVVIFKQGKKKAGKILPFSQFDSTDPEDLWDYLEVFGADHGGQAIAIPHNGNLSNGVMFALEDAKGTRISKSYAEKRSKWEPLYEVTQFKGDSEAHPVLSPDDQFADFETWEALATNTSRKKIKKMRNSTDYDHWIKTNSINNGNGESWKRTYEYARSGLKLGLKEKARVGVNPFKFGFIGSTDSHTSLATAEENNFWGQMTGFGLGDVSQEPSAGRIKVNLGRENRSYSAAGYAAVWATKNTRKAIFEAMKRRETYATTGARITVRFFGGWGFEKNAALSSNFVQLGYAGGVPMGGDLPKAPNAVAPQFLVRAVKDPDGANLERVQIIKGWRDRLGHLHEKIYNVAQSDRQNNSVNSTVNSKDASYTNTIGTPELAVVWEDPDFDSNELAFYYVRVLEIPTPRWPAYDAKYFSVKVREAIHLTSQERAYTSPIWYSP
jgi:Protein of unknown function (DUF3604)